MYYYDIVYTMGGERRCMYVLSVINFPNDTPTFVSDKLYPKEWSDVKAYKMSEKRVKFFKWREENRRN